MKNRAKCKLCSSIIESFHSTDVVSCKCGEISVDGGDALYCYANDWKNFLRVDDNGNEIIVKVSETEDTLDPNYKMTKKEMIEMLSLMATNIQKLPQNAMDLPITHYDFASLIILLSAIFESDLSP